MKGKEAANLFHGKERLNCAQAVFKAFKKENALPDSIIYAAKAFGGGRGPSGICGALYAAGKLISNDEIRDRMRSDFANVAGSTKCHEIRSLKNLNCRACVALAATLVESFAHSIVQGEIKENPVHNDNPYEMAAL